MKKPKQIVSMFNFLFPQYKITKPIRLIELFAGIGSQSKALKNIGANFETWKVVEFDEEAIKSYNAIHDTNFKTSDITKIHAKDLEIIDTKLYDYILTYSFPCTDLSVAGKQQGMQKGSGTRSGLLWEVERILEECDELPQVLLMENVPQVHSEENEKDFIDWKNKLESLGYKNFWYDLSATKFGIPQSRLRCFMISILGDYSYEFPNGWKLNDPSVISICDEEGVNEKYFLTKKQIEQIMWWNSQQEPFDSLTKEVFPTLTTRSCAYAGGMILHSNLDKKEEIELGKELLYIKNNIYKPKLAGGLGKPTSNGGTQFFQQDRIYDGKYVAVSLTANLPSGSNFYVLDFKDKIDLRKLTPKECFRLMGFTDEDYFKASKVNNDNALWKQTGNSICVPVLEAIFKQLL